MFSLPDTTKLLIFDLVSIGEGGEAFSSFDIPELRSLITRSGEDLLTIRRPTASIDTAFVCAVSRKRVFLLTSLSIIENAGLIRRNGTSKRAVGRETNAVDKPGVVRVRSLPFHRRTFEPTNEVIVTTGHDSIGPHLLEIATEEGLGVTGDLSDGGARIEEEGSTVLVPSFSHCHYPLAVLRPGHVPDRSAQRSKLDLQNVLCVGGVPDSDRSRCVSRSDVKATWRISCTGGRVAVLIVIFAEKWVIDASDHNAVSTSIEDIFSFGVTS